MAATGLSHVALKSGTSAGPNSFTRPCSDLRWHSAIRADMLFLKTPGGSDLLNFVKSAARLSGSQALDHIGFKVTPRRLKQIEGSLRSHEIKITGRRGKAAIYFFDPNGYQLEYYCD